MQRHPVWTGAAIGFGVGFSMTYLAALGEHREQQFFKGIDPGGPALFYGGIGAGIGALAGWGIARNR